MNSLRKYRKRPVVVEAIQYDGTDEGDARVCAFAPGVPFGHIAGRGLRVPTLEGRMVARPGDWIVRGIKGEFYPVRDDIFRATYEPVEEPDHD